MTATQALTEGVVAFESLREHDEYQGQSTGKFTLTLTLSDEEAQVLVDKGVNLKQYEGNSQRKFSSKFHVQVLNPDNDEPFMGQVTRGSKVRVQWADGAPHPLHGTPTYLNRVRVLELADNAEDIPEGF